MSSRDRPGASPQFRHSAPIPNARTNMVPSLPWSGQPNNVIWAAA